MIPIEENEEEYNRNFYFNDLEQFNNDIFTNGILKKENLIEQIKNIKKELIYPSNKDLNNLLDIYCKLETYDNKIIFWKENKLSPLIQNYFFTEKSIHKKISFFLLPQNDVETKKYFIYLTSWFNQYLTIDKNKYGIDFHSYSELVNSYNKEIIFSKEFIENELNKNERRIENSKSREIFFISDFIKFYTSKEEGTLLDMMSCKQLSLDELVIVSYLVSPVYGYLEYHKFLKEKLENKEFEIKNNFKEYRVPKDKTFRSVLTPIKLNSITLELIKENFIDEKDSDKFIRLFSEVNISSYSKKDILIWKDQRSGGVNWQSLFKLIEIIVEPDFYKYKSEIINIIDRTIESPDGSIGEKLSKSYTKTINDLKSDSKGSEKIIKIIENISFNK